MLNTFSKCHCTLSTLYLKSTDDENGIKSGSQSTAGEVSQSAMPNPDPEEKGETETKEEAPSQLTAQPMNKPSTAEARPEKPEFRSFQPSQADLLYSCGF